MTDFKEGFKDANWVQMARVGSSGWFLYDDGSEHSNLCLLHKGLNCMRLAHARFTHLLTSMRLAHARFTHLLTCMRLAHARFTQLTQHISGVF